MPSNNSFNGTNAARVPRSKRQQPFNVEGVKRNIIVIGASAGGVTALSELFAALPPRLPATIGVVLHRSATPGELAHVLRRKSALPIVEAEGVTPLKPGLIFLAPSDQHLLFEPSNAVIQRGPKEHSTRPAIDPLFRSAAAHYGRRVVGILLTGCGEDGVSGLIAISQAAGLTLVQDPDDAYMPYMPLNALRFDDVAGVFPLRDLAFVIEALVRGQTVPPRRAGGQRGVALA